ncbi:TonB-dependent receptor domain-containing protein [Mucilaginibacter rubeus]|uniref:TonB-dependent receptor domain-containing protein n=1 Tax=Mucilaginibacter rubeus TaxID=2027860 RepID=UPI001AA13130|nr:TonB-dependent receptor [Mucilaginibacter rubeus]QTE59014.1 TonB-dependent receptor [Mucilaginibacter rubeus]
MRKDHALSENVFNPLYEASLSSFDRVFQRHAIGFARIYKENSGPYGDVTRSRTAGAFFSGNYAFQNKYLLDASVRVDGSSAFGADRRYAPFGSLGIGWNIHKESFFRGANVISQLRLKGSIATLGSISFPAYQSRSIYLYDTQHWYSTGIGATILGYGNSNLEWQKTRTTDVGMDIGLFKDRIVISPRYYYKLTKGLITDINLAPSTGFSTYKDNLGDMSNKGYELYLVAQVFHASDWNINLTGNLAHNVNKIVRISDALKAFNSNIDNFQTNKDNNAFSTPLTRYVEGKSLNTIYAVKSLGIDPENGKEILVKKDGTLTYIWDVKDVQDVGNTTPKAEGFFGSTVSYKRFMLSFSFHYRFGGQAFNQTLIDRVENADPRFNVDSRVLEQRWKQPGDHTFFKNITDLTDTYVSSRFIQKDNLIELQSLYLSYDFKPNAIRRLGLQNLRLAATANDIFRASTIQAERGIYYPFARSLTFSLLGSF